MHKPTMPQKIKAVHEPAKNVWDETVPTSRPIRAAKRHKEFASDQLFSTSTFLVAADGIWPEAIGSLSTTRV